MTFPLSRRTVLRGMGTAVALPWLESMAGRASAAATQSEPPTRLGFVFIPNGVIKPAWDPQDVGPDYQLSETLQPLAAHKKDFLVLSGLAQDNARAKGDGPGDHARCAATYLTGVHPVKTSGADIRAGISVDQIAAEQRGGLTRLPSLELGTSAGRNAGQCDSGYSCAYSSNVSWKSPTTPMAKEIHPKLVFDRLFGEGGRDEQERKRRELYRKSVLDLVSRDAEQLRKRLGKTDQQKVDEYFTSVRELEVRIERSQELRKPAAKPAFKVPDQIPSDFREPVRLMYDLLVLAFQTDTTRVSTFMLANAGDNRSYKMVDVAEGHHQLSHHRDDEDKIAKLKRIDKFLIEQFAYFLDKLKSVREGEGTLLDHCLITYGSAIGDGNRHHHHDLPILLAGRGGGVETGRHIKYEHETPLNNLYLSMLQRFGGDVLSFGDSTGPLSELTT